MDAVPLLGDSGCLMVTLGAYWDNGCLMVTLDAYWGTVGAYLNRIVCTYSTSTRAPGKGLALNELVDAKELKVRGGHLLE